MSEILLALWPMTAGHHRREMPAREPVAILRSVETPGSTRELSAEERRELKTAVEAWRGAPPARYGSTHVTVGTFPRKRRQGRALVWAATN